MFPSSWKAAVAAAGSLTLLRSYVTTLGIGRMLNHKLASILLPLTDN